MLDASTLSPSPVPAPASSARPFPWTGERPCQYGAGRFPPPSEDWPSAVTSLWPAPWKVTRRMDPSFKLHEPSWRGST
jgi:hypothetical protein